MHDFWLFFLKKRQFTYLIIAGIVLAGVFSYLKIPKESAPEVKIPMGIVTTVYPGASAEDVEKLVTNKIEDGLNNLNGLSEITSTSRESLSMVVVEFDSNADIDKSIQNLKDEIDKIKGDLPDEAVDPTVTEISFSEQPIFIVSISSDLPATEFADLADEVKDEIRSVAGVSKVKESGLRERQVQVFVNKEQLDLFGLSISQVVSSLASMNASLPVGDLVVDDIRYSLKFSGDITNLEEIKNIPIATISGHNVYLREVAEVYSGVEEATSLSRFSLAGEPAVQSVTLSVYKKMDGDITSIGDNIKTKIAELQKTKLKGSNVLFSFDQSQMIKDDLWHLFRSGLETVTLIMVMLFLTLGWREAIVAALSVPLSFLIAFAGLYYTGNTINFISLFSLILAIGILIDSGIVVVESIYTRSEHHGDKLLAARETIREYSWPLIAGTLTTVMVFVPLFFLSGIVGKFVASIPYTTIFVLIASIFVALAIVPILAVLIVKKEENKMSGWQNKYTQIAQTWYRQNLTKILDNDSWQKSFIKWLVGGLFLSLLLPVFGLVSIVFFPQTDADYLYLDIEKPKGTILAQTDLTVRTIEEILYHNKNVESFVTTVGSGSQFSSFSSGDNGTNLANITINLKEKRRPSSTEILASLNKDLAVVKNAEIRLSEPTDGPPVGSPVEIKIIGDDLVELAKAGVKIEQLLTSIKGVRNITSTAADELPDFVLTLNRSKAAELGLNSLTVAQTLRANIYGVTATKIREGNKDIEVFVKTNLNPINQYSYQTNETVIESINNLNLNTANGPILLGSVLDNSLKRGNSSIAHENNRRIVTVSAELEKGYTVTSVIGEFNKKKNDLKLPNGIEVTTGGESEEMTKTFIEMLQALILGMLLMMIVLVLEFNSFRYAFYVLSIIPLSLSGVLVGLTITRQAVSFTSILGFIALAGVIVNHTILLIDSVDRLRRKHPERSMRDLVVEAATTRFRPIILTTITTVIGMIPLIFVSAMWGPLAFTVMFGLAFSVLLTLLFVPIIIYRWPGKAKTE